MIKWCDHEWDCDKSEVRHSQLFLHQRRLSFIPCHKPYYVFKGNNKEFTLSVDQNHTDNSDLQDNQDVVNFVIKKVVISITGKMGDRSFFGPGLTVDMKQLFVVVTQFHGSPVTQIRRKYVLNAKVIEDSKSKITGTNAISDKFCE
jgi:hypothetical protein